MLLGACVATYFIPTLVDVSQDYFVLKVHRNAGSFRPLSHGYWMEDYETVGRNFTSVVSEVTTCLALSTRNEPMRELLHELALGDAC